MEVKNEETVKNKLKMHKKTARKGSKKQQPLILAEIDENEEN